MVTNLIGKLGRKPAVRDLRTLKLSSYLKDAPPAPPRVDNSKGIAQWGMLANDQLGDCTIAACFHAVQSWRLSISPELFAVPDYLAVEYYSKWDGYVSGDPSTDQGGGELDVLKKWRKSTLAGHNLKAFVEPDPGNAEHIRQSVYLFGGVYIGVNLPSIAFDQEVWDVVADDGGAAGGHAVWVLGYDPETLTCVTWGKLQKMTWRWWEQYTEEAHCLMSDTDWMPPDGVDYAALESDLKLVTS